MISGGRRTVRRVLSWGSRLIGGGHVLSNARKRSMVGRWDYRHGTQFPYGDETSYRKGMTYLDGHGTIEDWGCGTAFAKRFATRSAYIGIDGSPSAFRDKAADLRTYASNADCIFMRHVLEHNYEWRAILKNAISSFQLRMVLIIFTPFADETGPIATSSEIPDIAFRKEDLIESFRHLHYSEESLQTPTQYETEHIFYIEKRSSSTMRPS